MVCLCWLLALGCFTSTAFAQYRFDQWTADTGLPQNIITAIQQTPEGYLWVATLDGLTRFDGVRFTVFNKSNTPGLRSNRFICLYQDSAGDLWAGTEVGVVTRYHQGQFTTYATEHGLPQSEVWALAGDSQGRLRVLSGTAVREWDPVAGRFIEREALPSSSSAGRLGWKGEGGYWSLDRADLRVFANGAWTHVTLPAEAGAQMTQAAQSDDGAIWIGTARGQVFRIREKEVTSFPLRNPPARAHPVTEWHDRSGRVWEMEIARNLERKLMIPSSGPPDTITVQTFYEDRDGNLWLGTDGQGLFRIRKQIITTYSTEQGLIGRNVYPVYEDRSGAIWVGAWEGGISRIKAGKITNFTTREGLASGAVTAFFEDRVGRLWIASHTDLQTFAGGHFTSVRAENSADLVRPNAIYQDRSGSMWFGTDRGLVRYTNGQTHLFTTQDGLPGNTVRSIIEAAGGGVWVGTYGGLLRWRDGKITAWTERDGLPGNAVRALYEDQEGVLWIGTYDSGLGRFKDGKFTRYTTSEGLFNDGVFQILEDAFGYLWMSSNRGIYRVRKQELNEVAAGARHAILSIPFGKNDGMRNVECNGGLWPAGARAHDGRLWFPTQDGVAVIDPAAVTISQKPPPVLIEAVLQNQAPVAFRDEVRLRPGQGNLEIQYTALSFANAPYLHFKHRLEGLDPEWVDAGTRRTAFFSYLPPGRYTFNVIAANSDGVWNTEGKSLRIMVLAPFYRTWWFSTLLALGALGASLGVFKYRLRQLEHRQALQQAFARQLMESQETERRRIAAELHDSLGQNLLVIRNRALLGKLTPQDERLKAEFDEISAVASQTLEEIRSIAQNLRPSHLDQLGLRTSLEAMLDKLAESCAIRFTSEIDDVDGLFAPEDEITLYRIVQEGLNNVIKHSQATEAHVAVRRRGRELTFTIQDNGRGFALNASRPAIGGGFGLTGLAERVRMLGGTHTIESALGRGTRVTITLDVPEPGQEPAANEP
jgi:signal transduction histidine kinase/ligand-binding sensor domain-containing protein